MPNTGVYCIRNSVNGKLYIGSTASLGFKRRWVDHKVLLRKGRHHSKHLQAAWSKYGENSFEFEVMLYCAPEECIAREQEYIDYHKSFNDEYGYNASPTAGSRLGVKLSEEVRVSFSITAKKCMNRPEVKKKLSESTTEAMKDLNLRNKLSESAKVRFSSEVERAKASERAKECQNRPEVIQKRRSTISSKEYREKLSKSIRKSWKERDRSKAYRPDWSNEEYRTNQSRSMKAGKETKIRSMAVTLRGIIGNTSFTREDIGSAGGYISPQRIIDRLLALGIIVLIRKAKGKIPGEYNWT